MIFAISIICSIILSVVGYFGFDWMMRYIKVDFRHFTVKAQRLISATIGIVFVIPLVIVRIVQPETENIYWYLLTAEGLIFILYSGILSICSNKVTKMREIKQKILMLKLEHTNDTVYLKQELKSWYDISASTKEIENALEQIREEQNIIK